MSGNIDTSAGHSTRVVVYAVVFVVLAALVSYYYSFMRILLCIEYEPATLDALVHGRADVPFQYRILAPMIGRVLFELASAMKLDISLYGIFSLVEWAAAGALILAFHQYLADIFHDRRLGMICAFSIILVLPFNYLLMEGSLYYPSDTLSLAFMVMLLICLYRRKWLWYYPLFILATFNRETTCFVTMMYVLASLGRDRMTTIALHGAVQTAIWVSIKIILAVIFADNGQALYEPHLGVNLSLLAQPGRWPILASSMAFIWIPVLIWARHIEDQFVRRALWVTAPFLVGMLLVGNVVELRIYGELIPLYLSAGLLLLRRHVRQSG